MPDVDLSQAHSIQDVTARGEGIDAALRTPTA